MPTLDALFGNQTELTAAIDKAPFVPNIISRRGYFSEDGISTLTAFIEFRGSVLSLVPSIPRGGVGQPATSTPRAGIEVPSVCLLKTATVYADQVQDVRAFGQNGPESPEEVKARIIAQMRQDLEWTFEYHRAGALRGLILDADGSTLFDVFSEFGITQSTLSLALSDDATDLVAKIVAAERLCEDALGGYQPERFDVLAAPDVIDALRNHPDYSAKASTVPDLEDDGRRRGIRIANTMIYEYRSVTGGPAFIPAGEAYMIPRDVPDLLLTRFSPADYLDTVNTKGRSIYMKSELGYMGKFVSLEAQSNVINIPTRPKAIVKLTKG